MDRRLFAKTSLAAASAAMASTAGFLAASAASREIVILPKDLLLGAATSAYQVEGAWNEDGKGESIWDRYAHAGILAHGVTGDVACDQYHRYREDVALMNAMNLRSYRFSISWPRVLPAGLGAVNQKGLDYYKSLSDALHEAGIRPFCTLYHWDLPQALEDKGGWPNRDLAGWFADYAALMAKHLGDRVTVWAPFNMPWAIAYDGYGRGGMAPGKKDMRLFWKAAHTLALAHGQAFRALKAASAKATVGSAWEYEPVIAKTTNAEDAAAAARFDVLHNRFFMNAALRGEYPKLDLDLLGFKPGDEKIIRTPLDWVGVHYYLRLMISARSEPAPGSLDPLDGIVVELSPEGQRSPSGWEMWPNALHDMLLTISRDYDYPIIEISETGTPYPDTMEQMEDGARVFWYRQHLAALVRAMNDGARVRAYHAWSLLDNLEWRDGFTRRYGLVHVDFRTLQRTVKESGRWYGKLAATRNLEV